MARARQRKISNRRVTTRVQRGMRTAAQSQARALRGQGSASRKEAA